jgi:hypothetical protein
VLVVRGSRKAVAGHEEELGRKEQRPTSGGEQHSGKACVVEGGVGRAAPSAGAVGRGWRQGVGWAVVWSKWRDSMPRQPCEQPGHRNTWPPRLSHRS